jgi:hypothetical protein
MSKIKTILLSIIFLAVCVHPLFGMTADRNLCMEIADAKIVQQGLEDMHTVSNITSYTDGKGEVLFYIFELDPKGFMIISADTDLPPIIGYSFRNTFDLQDETSMPFRAISQDISYRYAALPKLPESIKQQRNDMWADLLNNKEAKEEMYWPNQDSTVTGGWVQAQWNQSAPFYNYCPWDLVTSARSLAGCPAIATAQIIDYFTNINGAFFDDSDDYYHSYAGRDFWIDTDYFTRGFASFPQLNSLLNTYDAHKKLHQELTNFDKAALCFACGVAATQVYTSTVSGTFYLSQVVDALEKFGYYGTDTIDDSAPIFWTRLSQNMMDAQPAELTVLVTGGSGGHNVVVDGYNTLNEYHVNFGWNGSYDGWYILPDEFPYSLTTIHGVTLDIYSDPVPYYDPPASLVYSSNQSPAYIDLSWQVPVQAGVISYNVYRDDVLLNSEPVYTQTFHDDTAIYGIEYEYYVTAIYDIGESNPSNTIVINWNVAVDEPSIANGYASISFPNPFNPKLDVRTSIRYYQHGTTHNSNIEIYNIKGEIVRRLTVHDISSGIFEASWDGKDDNGNIVPSGVYLYSLENEQATLQKILILR